MGVWYYLVNITKKERVEGNYGKWDEFNPLEAFDQAKKDYLWSDSDECCWVSDEADMIKIPLEGYVWPWQGPLEDDYDEDAAIQWWVDHTEDSPSNRDEMIWEWPVATKMESKPSTGQLELKALANAKPKCSGKCKNGAQCRRDASPKSPGRDLCWQHMAQN